MEYLLWAYFLLYPVYIYYTWEGDKRLVLLNPNKRIGLYVSTIAMLWLPVLVLMFVVFQSSSGNRLALDDIGFIFNQPISFEQLGLVLHLDLENLIGLLCVFVLSAYFYYSLKRLKNGQNRQKTAQEQATLRQQMTYIQWFLPTNPKEYRWFIFGVSVTAGICEEILFRGYLLHALGEYVPMYGAVLISSVLFGLPHIYQGPTHVFRTALLGLILSLIYWATGSLLVPVLLHIVVDVYGGALAYVVFGAHLKPSCSENSN